MKIQAIKPELHKMLEFHFNCEHNARLLLQQKQQQQKTKFPPRTATGFNEVEQNLKRNLVKLIIFAEDLDENVGNRKLEIEQMCAQQEVPHITCFTKEDLGQMQTQSRQLPDKKRGASSVGCMGILFEQPIFHELQSLKSYLSGQLQDQPFKFEAAQEKRKKQQKLLINPFNPKHFQQKFKLTNLQSKQIKYQFEEGPVKIITNLLVQGAQKEGNNNMLLIGSDEKISQLYQLEQLKYQFTIAQDQNIFEVETIQNNGVQLSHILQLVYEINPSVQLIKTRDEQYKELNFQFEDGWWVLQCGIDQDDDIFVE